MLQRFLLVSVAIGCAPPEPSNPAEGRAYHLNRFGLAEMPRVGSRGDSVALWLEISQAFDSTVVFVVERGGGQWRGTVRLQTTPERRATRRTLPAALASQVGLATVVTLASLPLRPPRGSIQAFDGCAITAELRDSTGYREWYYDNPWSFRTGPDTLMIALVRPWFRLAGLPALCEDY